MEQHAAMVEARVERVAAVVAAFEAQMAAFFERLNAEEDPTRIATMAETMPDPPSLADVAASVGRRRGGPPGTRPDERHGNRGRRPLARLRSISQPPRPRPLSFSGDLETDDDGRRFADAAEPVEASVTTDERRPLQT